MTNATPVLDYLNALVGTHKFSTTEKEGSAHSNFSCAIDKTVDIRCMKGFEYSIPTGTQVVVYRHPVLTLDKRKKLACFHHPGEKRQTVVYAGGKVVDQDLSRRPAYGGSRRLPKLSTPDR